MFSDEGDDVHDDDDDDDDVEHDVLDKYMIVCNMMGGWTDAYTK